MFRLRQAVRQGSSALTSPAVGWLIDLNGSRVLLLVAAPVTSVLVLKGFVRERGRAIAYVELGMPVAAMIFVPLTQMFIDWWGWETTWIVLSAIGLGVIVPELISEVVEIEKAQVTERAYPPGITNRR